MKLYKDWVFVDCLGAGYWLKDNEQPKLLYGRDPQGTWFWFKKSGEDCWIRRKEQVPRRIQMAAMLME